MVRRILDHRVQSICGGGGGGGAAMEVVPLYSTLLHSNGNTGGTRGRVLIREELVVAPAVRWNLFNGIRYRLKCRVKLVRKLLYNGRLPATQAGMVIAARLFLLYLYYYSLTGTSVNR